VYFEEAEDSIECSDENLTNAAMEKLAGTYAAVFHPLSGCEGG
jgi:hypothetical protein